MSLILSRAADGARHGAHAMCAPALRAAGGPARARVAGILAAVLALNGADQATVSATANNLEPAFHVGNTAIGLLITVTALAGAAFTLPVGVLTDRTRRTALLACSIVAWAAAIFCCGLAQSYHWLLIARIALGAVSATAGPTIASLVGDFVPAADRGRMYGLILGGDLVGTGIGFVVSGDISSILSWRFAFWWLVLPGLALAWLAWRLPEPARDGRSRLAPGAEHIPHAQAMRAWRPSRRGPPAAEPPGPPDGREPVASEGAADDGAEPDTAQRPSGTLG